MFTFGFHPLDLGKIRLKLVNFCFFSAAVSVFAALHLSTHAKQLQTVTNW